MVETQQKYSKYRLNTLPPEKRYRSFGRWPQTVLFTDNDIIEGSNHFWATWVVAEPIPTHGPHTHRDDELLVMLGSDPDNKADLGCEVEICMGPEMEKHTFRESNLVHIPANFVHGPIRFRNLKRPFVFIQAQRAPKLTEKPLKDLVSKQEWDKMAFFDFAGKQTDADVQKQLQQVQELITKLKKLPVMVAPGVKSEPVKTGADTKYGKYFLSEISPEQRQRKFGASASTIVYTDDDIIKGSNLFWSLWRREPPRPGFGHGPHSHNHPESLVTIGSDPNNPQDAGVKEMDYMGVEMEKYETAASNLLFMPAGLVHGPQRDLVFRRPWIMAQCQYAPKLSEKSYKKLVSPAEGDNMVFFDLKGTETELELDKQRKKWAGSPPQT